MSCFLYGGIGDQLIVIKILNQLNKSLKIQVYLDQRFKELSQFISSNDIIFYNSKRKINFLLNLLLFKKTKNEIYFSHTSSYIHYIIFLIGRFKVYLGVNGNFNKILIMNKEFYTPIVNRYELYRYILNISDIKFNYFDEDKIFKKNYYNYLKKKFNYHSEYIVINIYKTNYWGDISTPLTIWLEFLNKNLYLETKKLIVVGDSSQIDINKKLISNLNHNDIIDLTGKTNLIELAYLIYKSQFVICNDSGIMHIANFFQKKNFSLFTFSNPKIYIDKSFTHSVFKKKYNCQPCVSISPSGNDNYPPICKNYFSCSKSIEVNLIQKEFNYFLQANRNN